MKCPDCGITAKSLDKSEDKTCPDCGVELEKQTPETLLEK